MFFPMYANTFAVLYVHNALLGTGFMHTFVRTTREPNSHEGDIVVEWQKYYKGLSWNFSVRYLGVNSIDKKSEPLTVSPCFLSKQD